MTEADTAALVEQVRALLTALNRRVATAESSAATNDGYAILDALKNRLEELEKERDEWRDAIYDAREATLVAQAALRADETSNGAEIAS